MQQRMINPMATELGELRRKQLARYWYTYSLSAVVRNGDTAAPVLTIDNDADFMVHELTISAYGPVNEDGTRIGTGATIGQTGVTDFPLYANTEAAMRGLAIDITDSGTGRSLTGGEIPVECIGTPGYGNQLFRPYVLKYMAIANSKLRFSIRNRDLAVTAPGGATQYHAITIGLTGYKYVANPDMY